MMRDFWHQLQTISENSTPIITSLWMQSTILITLGLFAGYLFRSRGPVWQTLIYKTTMTASLVLGIASIITHGHIQALWTVPITHEIKMEIRTPANPILNMPQPSAMMQSEVIHSAINPSQSIQIWRPNMLELNSMMNSMRRQSMSAHTTVETINTPLSALQWSMIVIAILEVTGSVLLLLWLFSNVLLILRLRRSAQRITEAETLATLTKLAQTMKIKVPALLMSPQVHSPFLTGLMNPTILLPSTYVANIGDKSLRAVLAHELVHARNCDLVWIILSRLTTALLWSQPLIWILSKRLGQSIEEVCDQQVVLIDGSSVDYADALLRFSEQWQPTQQEKLLGAGIVSYRSSLGKRIEKILTQAQTHWPPLSQNDRWNIFASSSLAILAVLLLVSCVTQVKRSFATVKTVVPVSESLSRSSTPWAAPQDYLANFQMAKQHGWTTEPVTFHSLQEDLLKDVPALSQQDSLLLDQCNFFGMDDHSFQSSTPLSVRSRQEIEHVLAKHPHFFYAEYLLSEWYANHRNAPQANIWRDAAYQDAPAILAGRLQDQAGYPIAGFQMTLSIVYENSHNSFVSGSPLTNPMLQQFIRETATTDAQGCYYLPMLPGLFHQTSLTYVQNNQATGIASQIGKTLNIMPLDKNSSDLSPQSQMHQFIANFQNPSSDDKTNQSFHGKVGIVPPIFARPYLALNLPFDKQNRSVSNPVQVSSPDLTISWLPYPGATKYRVEMNRSDTKSKILSSFFLNNPSLENGFPEPHFTLSLSKNNPIFDKRNTYSLTVYACDDKNDLTKSQPYKFRPQAALAPLPFTRQGLLQALPQGSDITSMTKKGQTTTIIGTAPSSGGLRPLIERNLFENMQVTSQSSRSIPWARSMRQSFEIQFTPATSPSQNSPSAFIGEPFSDAAPHKRQPRLIHRFPPSFFANPQGRGGSII